MWSSSSLHKLLGTLESFVMTQITVNQKNKIEARHALCIRCKPFSFPDRRYSIQQIFCEVATNKSSVRKLGTKLYLPAWCSYNEATIHIKQAPIWWTSNHQPPLYLINLCKSYSSIKLASVFPLSTLNSNTHYRTSKLITSNMMYRHDPLHPSHLIKISDIEAISSTTGWLTSACFSQIIPTKAKVQSSSISCGRNSYISLPPCSWLD